MARVHRPASERKFSRAILSRFAPEFLSTKFAGAVLTLSSLVSPGAVRAATTHQGEEPAVELDPVVDPRSVNTSLKCPEPLKAEARKDNGVSIALVLWQWHKAGSFDLDGCNKAFNQTFPTAKSFEEYLANSPVTSLDAPPSVVSSCLGAEFSEPAKKAILARYYSLNRRFQDSARERLQGMASIDHLLGHKTFAQSGDETLCPLELGCAGVKGDLRYNQCPFDPAQSKSDMAGEVRITSQALRYAAQIQIEKNKIVSLVPASGGRVLRQYRSPWSQNTAKADERLKELDAALQTQLNAAGYLREGRMAKLLRCAVQECSRGVRQGVQAARIPGDAEVAEALRQDLTDKRKELQAQTQLMGRAARCLNRQDEGGGCMSDDVAHADEIALPLDVESLVAGDRRDRYSTAAYTSLSIQDGCRADSRKIAAGASDLAVSGTIAVLTAPAMAVASVAAAGLTAGRTVLIAGAAQRVAQAASLGKTAVVATRVGLAARTFQAAMLGHQAYQSAGAVGQAARECAGASEEPLRALASLPASVEGASCAHLSLSRQIAAGARECGSKLTWAAVSAAATAVNAKVFFGTAVPAELSLGRAVATNAREAMRTRGVSLLLKAAHPVEKESVVGGLFTNKGWSWSEFAMNPLGKGANTAVVRPLSAVANRLARGNWKSYELTPLRAVTQQTGKQLTLAGQLARDIPVNHVLGGGVSLYAINSLYWNPKIKRARERVIAENKDTYAAELKSDLRFADLNAQVQSGKLGEDAAVAKIYDYYHAFQMAEDSLKSFDDSLASRADIERALVANPLFADLNRFQADFSRPLPVAISDIVRGSAVVDNVNDARHGQTQTKTLGQALLANRYDMITALELCPQIVNEGWVGRDPQAVKSGIDQYLASPAAANPKNYGKTQAYLRVQQSPHLQTLLGGLLNPDGVSGELGSIVAGTHASMRLKNANQKVAPGVQLRMFQQNVLNMADSAQRELINQARGNATYDDTPLYQASSGELIDQFLAVAPVQKK